MNHQSKIKVLLASTSRCTRQESVDINTLKTTKNGEEKIMQLIAITCRSPRIRKRNQFRQFISAINQAFHRSSKSGSNNPRYLLLQHIPYNQVAIRNTGPEKETVLHAWPDDRIKALVFQKQLQQYRQFKDSRQIIKKELISSRAHPSIFASITPTSTEFFQC